MMGPFFKKCSGGPVTTLDTQLFSFNQADVIAWCTSNVEEEEVG
jgi:hypothetical protein